MAAVDNFRMQLRAYLPLGVALGPIPMAKFEVVWVTNDLPVLTVRHPAGPYVTADGEPDEDAALRYRWLLDRCEIGVEYSENDGEDWNEPTDGRFLQIGRRTQRLDKLGNATFRYIGYGWLMSKANVYEPSPTDVGASPVMPVRRFGSPDDLASCGQVIRALWLDARNRVGTNGLHWGEIADDDDNRISRGFTEVNDANGDPWGDEGLAFDLPIQESLLMTLRRYVSADQVDFRWHERRLDIVARGGFDRERAVGILDPTLIRDGDGVTTAPQDVGYEHMMTSSLLIGAAGLFFTKDHDDPDGTYGRLEGSIEAGDVFLEEVAEKVQDAFLDRGSEKLESNMREVRFDDAQVRPLADVRIHDRVLLWRGKNPVGEDLDPDPQRVVAMTVTKDDEGIHGSYIFGRRRDSAPEALLRKIERLADGAYSWGTKPTPPTHDGRVPVAPTGVVVSMPVRLNQAGHSRAYPEVTWTVVDPWQAPDPETGDPTDINLQQFRVERRKGAAEWQDVGGSAIDATLPWFDRDLDPSVAWTYRVRAIAEDGTPGLPSSTVAGTGTADQDPVMGASLVRDAGFESSLIRAARATDAGAGFAFGTVSGRYRAQFTTVTPVLALGVAETPVAGRRQVIEGEKYLIRCKARRVGGTAAAVRGQIRWYDASASIISTVDAFTATVTTSDASYEGVLTAPAGAVRGNARFKASTITGAATLEVVEPQFDRQAATNRIETDAVVADKIDATDNLTSKHTSTAALFQAASGASGWKGGTAGLYFYDGAGLAFEATGAGVYVRGALEAGGIIIESSTIDFGGLYTITYTGSSFEINAALTDFSGAVAAAGALSTSSTLTVTGTSTLNGALDHNGSTFGVLGQAPRGQWGISAAATDLATVITLANSLRSAGLDFGFLSP